MDISLADVVLHIDEALPAERWGRLEGRLRAVDGVVSVQRSSDKPHLAIVGYRPDKASAQSLLDLVLSEGVHAELVGL